MYKLLLEKEKEKYRFSNYMIIIRFMINSIYNRRNL